MMIKFLILFSLIQVSLLTRYKDCGSKAKINEVVVTPCTDNPPCIFPRGEVADINVQFIPIKGAESIITKVYGYIFGVKVSFPLKKCVNPCEEKDCGIECPLLPGKEYNFTVAVPIAKGYPKISVVAELQLVSEAQDKVVCIEITAAIV